MGIRNKPGPTRNYEEVTKAMATATASGAAAKTQNYLHSTAATNVAAVLPCATYCCHLMAMARCRCFCPVTSNIQHPCQDRIPKYSSMSSCANMEAPGDVFTSLRIVVIVVSWPGFNWLWLPSILASTRCSVSARFSLPIGSPFHPDPNANINQAALCKYSLESCNKSASSLGRSERRQMGNRKWVWVWVRLGVRDWGLEIGEQPVRRQKAVAIRFTTSHIPSSIAAVSCITKTTRGRFISYTSMKY